MDDYQDGGGQAVHSRYERWSANGAVGWTPDEATRVELSGARSDGEAAYADRMMDGVKFSRENLGLRLERRNISRTVQSLEGQLYYNYVDHVMDNYSLRPFTPSMMMPNPSVSNPDRRTVGGRVAAAFELRSRHEGDAGRRLAGQPSRGPQLVQPDRAIPSRRTTACATRSSRTSARSRS